MKQQLMSFAIETKDLTYYFGRDRKAVNDLSLQVPAGCIYGFLGPNGAGKTTTIRLLTGMLLSDRDNIFIDGESLQKNIPRIFNSMGALIETPSLYLHLTARENLSIIATLRSLSHSRMDEVLSIVGLSRMANRKVKHFSLGMKQRLGIAMALLPDPHLLILDEPANGLDPQGIIEVRELLISLNRDHGKTIFVSSHLLHEVEKTCTHIGIIHQGKLQHQGSLEDLKQQAYASGDVVFKIPSAGEWLPQVRSLFSEAKQVSTDEIMIAFDDESAVINMNRVLVQSGVPISGMKVSGGLEEWFIRLINKDRQIA